MNTSRRDFLRYSALCSFLLNPKELWAQSNSPRAGFKHFIFVNLPGAPSQFETFDPKPGSTYGGPTKAVKTHIPGVQFASPLEGLADFSDNMAVVRMSSREGNHSRAQYHLQTGGYLPVGVLKHPSMTSLVAAQKEQVSSDLPPAISLGRGALPSGYLGLKYEPFLVDKPQNGATNILVPEARKKTIIKADKIRQELNKLSPFRKYDPIQEELDLQERARRLSLGKAAQVFDLSKESPKTQEKYGSGQFASSCLLAKRLVDAGVPAIQIQLGGWDTHQDNFNRSATLATTLNQGLHALITDLKANKKYDDTLILVAGEFGRTPRINANEGRDHYPKCWTSLILGGRVKAQQIGRSNDLGTAVTGGTSLPQLSYSLMSLLGVDPNHWYETSVGRPIKITPKKEAIPGFII